VDRVVMGTILRAGDQLRAAAQLVEAPGGTLITSHTVQSSLGDLFRLQDDIARRVVDALALPLGGGDASPMPNAPRDPRAYELYLRGNELARTYEGLIQARDLYQECVRLDPDFAPAWAQLGRCHRVIGKFIEVSPDSHARAEQALRRALAINPRLAVAHKFYAQLEGDMGQTQRALLRLLGEAGRHGNDPELFAGLVHTLRYCGLFDEAIAAHEEARRLDPTVATSLVQTLLTKGDFDGVLAAQDTRVTGGGDEGIRIIALGLAGRREEAMAAVRLRGRVPIPAFDAWTGYLEAWLQGRPPAMVAMMGELAGLTIMGDPEAIFQEGWMLCDVGEHERGLEFLKRAVARGYFVAPTLTTSRQFDALRDNPTFQAVLAEAEAGRQKALAAFREAGGERLLGGAHRS
jgi:tetratricopeptide (TPR) repeat protein